MKKVKLNNLLIEEAEGIGPLDNDVLNQSDVISMTMLLATNNCAIDNVKKEIKEIDTGVDERPSELSLLINNLETIENQIIDRMGTINDEELNRLTSIRSELENSINDITNNKLNPLKDKLKLFKDNKKKIESNEDFINFIVSEEKIGVVVDDNVQMIIYPEQESVSYEFAEGINPSAAIEANDILADSVIASYIILSNDSNESELNRLCDEGILKKNVKYKIKKTTKSSVIRNFDSNCEDIFDMEVGEE